jgi:Transposase.
MLCIRWDQSGIVYYELLEPGKTVNAQHNHQQMINFNHALIEKRAEWAKRHGKVILLHENAPFHTSKFVKEALKSLGWDILPHPPYFPDLAPSISLCINGTHHKRRTVFLARYS